MSKIDLSQYAISNKAKEESSSWLNREIEITRIFSSSTKLGEQLKVKIYGQLGTLLKADVDLRSCLEIVGGQQQKSKWITLLLEITEDVMRGSELSDAFKDRAGIPPFDYHSIAIGEQTGKLADALMSLHAFYKQKIVQRRKLISAFSYPFVVLITALLVVFFMLRFLVPMFDDVYRRFGGELPAITKHLVATSNYIDTYGIYVLCTILVFLLLYYFNRKRAEVQRQKSRILLSIPLIGRIVRINYLERFSRFMGLLTSAKVPLNQALELTGKTIGNYTFSRQLKEVHQAVLHGAMLSQAMDKHAFFDKKSIALVKVGEEVNQLDVMFEKLAEEYKDDFDYQTDMLNKFLEPALIIFLGIIVGFILIALYLPMFKLSTSFAF